MVCVYMYSSRFYSAHIYPCIHDISPKFDVASDFALMIGVFLALRFQDSMFDAVSESLPSGIVKNLSSTVGRIAIFINSKHVRST
jgi:hypothetical protein